ncbi:MAG: bactofilin family protein [Candidatus Promineifilaceae bacterium]
MRDEPAPSLSQRLSAVLRGGARRKGDELVIDGYHVGDLLLERDIALTPAGSVAGNLSAPRVVVGGMVYGSVTARELVVEDGGQVWGDVYATSIKLLPGGKIHGWVSSFDEGTLDLLRGGELAAGDIPGVGVLELPPELLGLLEGRPQDESSGAMLPILRQLQAEAAAAMAARRELEATLPSRPASADADGRRRAVDIDVQAALQQADAFRDQLMWTSASLAAAQAELEACRTGLESLSQVSGRQVPTASAPAGSPALLKAELERMEQTQAAQGEFLAFLQATLVERDLELSRSQQQIGRQAEQIKRLAQVASRRIRQLEASMRQKGAA